MNPSGGLQPGQPRSTVVSPAPSRQSVIAAAMDTGAIGGAGSLDADLEGTAAVIAAEERQARENSRIARETHSRGRWTKFAVIAVVALVGLSLVFIRHSSVSQQARDNAADASDRFPTTPIPLEQLNTNSPIQTQNQSLSVNGQLDVNSSIVIAPTTQPNGAVTGQLYYDQTTNQLSYYNGTSFQDILSGAQTSISGVIGAINTGTGLGVSGNTVRNTGVLSLQGQTGNIALVAGPGIVVNGTTLSNSGVLSLGGQGGNIALGSNLSLSGNTLNAANKVNDIAGTGSITVGHDSNGNYTIGLTAVPGTGTVTSSGTATTGTIAMFTGVQNIEQSVISQSGGTITVGGNLTVNGTINGTSLSLTNPLGVTNGGTGLSSYTQYGILYASGSSTIGQLGVGTSGECLISGGTLAAPGWQACPGSGVSSVSSLTASGTGTALTGGITINNATSSGNTITLQNAAADGATKGIAAFNSTNFKLDAPGVINTTQDINISAAPSFGQLTLSSSQAVADMLTVNNTNGSGTGNLLNLKLGGNSKLSVSAAGNVTGGTYNGQTISNAANFTGNLTVAGTLGVNTISPSSALTVGVSGQAFTLQGNQNSIVKATDGVNSTTLAFQDPTASVTYRFATAAANTYDICTTAGNCVGLGGSVTTSGSHDQYSLAMFNNGSGTTIGDSIVSQDVAGTTLTVNGALKVSTIKSVNGANTTTISVTAPTANRAISIPDASGTVAVSASGPLSIDSAGNLTCPTCLTTGGSGGTSGVSSVNGLSGSITIQGGTAGSTIVASSGTITIANASNTTYGFIKYDNSNLVLNGSNQLTTAQNITTTATPQFAGLTATGNVSITGVSSTLSLSNALSVGNGGTGLTSLTQYGILYASASGTISQLGLGSTNQCLMGNTGAAPTWQACPGSGGATSINGQSGALTVNGTANEITVANVGTTFTLSTPQNIGTGSDTVFNTTTGTNGIKTGSTPTTRIDTSGNLTNIGSITASSTIQGGSLTINSGGTITLNNLTGGSSVCLTLNASNVVGTAACPTGSFLTSSTGIQLQASTPGTQQTGHFNISGTGLLATLDSTGTTLGIGTSTATTINIGSVGSTVKGTAIHIGDTTDTTNAQTVIVGSIAAKSTTNTTLQGGSGPNAISIQAANLGTINVASVNNNTVNIGTGLTTGDINIGSTSGSGAITLGGSSNTGGVIMQGTGITQTVTGAASNPTDIVKGTSTGLFQVQNASSFAVLNVNTSSSQVTLGSATHLNGSLAFADSGDSNTVSISAASGGVLNTAATGTGTGTFGALNPTATSTLYTHNQAVTSTLGCSLFSFGGRQSATVTSMTGYTGVGAGAGNNDYSLAIYTGTSTQPTAELAATITGTIAGTAGANTLSLTATLTANTPYWLCVNSDSSTAQWASNVNTGANGGWSMGQTFGTWPATISGGSGFDYQAAWDITVNYTLAGSTSTVGTMSTTGQVTLQGANNNGSEFQVQDAAGENILSVSTGGSAAAGVTVNDGYLNLAGLSNPASVSVALSNGGSLPANTQIDYLVDAVDAQGNHTQATDAALSNSNNWFTTGSGTTNRTATITWNAVPGAVSYTVYYTTSFATFYSYSVAAGTTNLVDNGTVFSTAISNGATAKPFIYASATSGVVLQAGNSIWLDGAPTSNNYVHIGYDQYNQLILVNQVSGGDVIAQADSFQYNDENTGDTVLNIAGTGATTLMTPTNTASAFLIENSSGSSGIALQVSTSNVSTSGANGNNAILKLGKDSGTSRSINATGSINQNGADYAEYFAQAVPGQLQPGDVACMTTDQKAEKCTGDPNSQLLGVVSTTPGLVGNDIFDAADPAGSAVISMLGQVPVKVSDANGTIHTGDLLTFDPVTGLAVKATGASMTIGQALEDFSGATGTTNLYIHIGYYDPMGLQSDGVSSGYVVQNGNAVLTNLTLSGTAIINTLSANTATISNLNVTVALSTSNITVNGHIVTGGGTPTVAVGTTSGTGAAAAVTGTDTSGRLTVTLGASVTAGDLANLTFHAAYSITPNVTITAGDSNAGQIQLYVTPTTSGFSLSAATAANLNAGQTYTFYYHVLQ